MADLSTFTQYALTLTPLERFNFGMGLWVCAEDLAAATPETLARFGAQVAAQSTGWFTPEEILAVEPSIDAAHAFAVQVAERLADVARWADEVDDGE